MARYNMFLTSHNELLMFSSPCKMHFGFNSSEFHEGADLHLLQMILNSGSGATKLEDCEKSLPHSLHLMVSVLEPGIEVEMSGKCIYFDDWELIPKEPFLLKRLT